MRRTGTTVLIEDVAFPIAKLADATLDLQAILRHHGYHEAIIFGHALEGNLHFVFTQDFGDPAEVDRYARLMDDVCDLVVKKYDGSLKAEHGTGRNMAPFVEMEWGKEATDLMRRIKKLFDPDNLLNPGVILNDNPHAHLENLKPMPAAEDIVDRCIECGFCEPLCPSHRLTLSPRQRIVSVRELARRSAAGEPAGSIGADYAYMGLDTCAGCGLCSTACPVGIDTGDLTRRLRGRQLGDTARAVHAWTGENFGTLANASRLGLKVGHAASGVLGDNFLARISGGAWKKNMPHAGKAPTVRVTQGDPVVYFPTCGGRIFGPSTAGEKQLGDVIVELLTRAGYAPILPEGFDRLCCGQMLASKGMAAEAEGMSNTLEAALMKASENGKYPVIMDASTCTARMQKHLAGRLTLYDFHEFAVDALLPRLVINRERGPVALHVNCSVRKNGADGKLRQPAESLRRGNHRTGGRHLLRLCRRPRVRRAGAEPPCPAPHPRRTAGQLRLRRLDQPHLRNRPDRRNRAQLPIHRISARKMQSTATGMLRNSLTGETRRFRYASSRPIQRFRKERPCTRTSSSPSTTAQLRVAPSTKPSISPGPRTPDCTSCMSPTRCCSACINARSARRSISTTRWRRFAAPARRSSTMPAPRPAASKPKPYCSKR